MGVINSPEIGNLGKVGFVSLIFIFLNIFLVGGASAEEGIVAEYHFDGNAAFSSGVSGQALSLDGVDDFVEVLSSESLKLNESVSISLWFKTESTDTQPLIHKSTSYDIDNYNLAISQYIPNLYWDYDGPVDYSDSDTLLDIGSWYHIVVTGKIGEKDHIYINGNEVPLYDHQFSAPNILITDDNPLEIGRYVYSNRRFKGTINELKIYNRVLTPTEIEALYNLEPQPECDDLDEDGFTDSACGGTDCNDNDSDINPGALESCNQIDDNCDGQIDGSCSGNCDLNWLPPISKNKTFNMKGTIPIKFSVHDSSSGSFVIDESVKVDIKSPSGDTIFSASYGTGEDDVKIDEVEEKYQINFHGKVLELPAELYAAEVSFDNGDSSSIQFELVQKNSKNANKGKNVKVKLDMVDAAFENIEVAGILEETVLEGNPAENLPEEFRIRGNFLDISTDSTYSGSIIVCVSYSDSLIGNEEKLKLFHWDGSKWVDITSNIDSIQNKVCGVTTSLSPFVIAESGSGNVMYVEVNGARITFEDVTNYGTTSASILSNVPGFEVPSGFRVSGDFYNVTTDATYSGKVMVCLPQNATGIDQSRLKMFHANAAGWNDITVSLDTGSRYSCGKTDSLSPFIVLEDLEMATPWSEEDPLDVSDLSATSEVPVLPIAGLFGLASILIGIAVYRMR